MNSKIKTVGPLLDQFLTDFLFLTCNFAVFKLQPPNFKTSLEQHVVFYCDKKKMKIFSQKMHMNHQKKIMSSSAIGAEIEGRARRAPPPQSDKVQIGARSVRVN